MKIRAGAALRAGLFACAVAALGCSSIPKAAAMRAQDVSIASKQPVSIGLRVSGGQDFAFRISGTQFEQALRDSLADTGMFTGIVAPDAGDHRLDVVLGDGYGVESREITVLWSLSRVDTREIVWQELVTTRGQSHHFVGVVRNRRGLELAAQENIRVGLEKLSRVDLSARRVRIEGVTRRGDPAPCGKTGNPRCAEAATRTPKLSPLLKNVDQLVKSWRNKKSPTDPSGNETILDSTTSKIDRHRVELTAGIVIDEDDKPRLTKTYIGSLDSSSVDWDKALRSGDRIVGTVHTHPGGQGAQHYSKADIAMGKDLLSQARAQDAVYPGIGVLLYLVQPKDQGGGVLVYNVARDVIVPVP